MKKQFELFVILLILLFSTFTFGYKPLFPAVNATTYVEGAIVQDTVWTLVDSPFVVSGDIVVYSDAVLTIEPGVEVRFGEKFSLIVEGKLVANGTKDKMITFTSNKHDPETGDWSTIKFNGTQSSSLVYCLIEYGINGITVENGFLDIQNSLIDGNSENGIIITDGNVEIKNSRIANNTMGGIYIAGGGQVTIQNNVIGGNGDGIILTGNLTSEVNIQHNEILLNEQSGILFETNTHDNIVILNNTLSANSYGFYVSTNASTYITRNYVLENTVGIFYQKGKNHTAYFNDIYNNNLGMDVSAYATVNATRNYWGDKSGPYHESLNPGGKGNPVGGNGTNLDFIFFLTAPIEYNNVPPMAILWTDKTLIAPNQTVTFIGTDSYDDGRVDQYFFDFGDGTNSSWTTLSIFTHTYSAPPLGTYNAILAVKDDFGAKSESNLTVIKVQDLTPLEAFITLSNYTVNYNEEISVTVYVTDGINAVENATVTLFSIKGGSFTPISGLTNSTGYFTASFTAPNVTEITDVRIIARASKSGYADGSDHKYLKVLPPFAIQVITEPATVKSEEKATVTIYVTIGFEQPVEDALLLLSCDQGNLSATIGVTDANGSATFIFTAPQTLSQINVTITVTAMKIGYEEEHGQGTIIVEPKILVVEVTAEPSIIISESVSTITAYVTYEAAPLSGVTVAVSSDSGGNFSTTIEITDSSGNARFVFTAPQTTEMFNTTIIVTATKNGYVSGEGQITITVVPKVLSVEISAEPNVTISEARINVTVYVTYAMVPVSNVNVTVASENGGNFTTNTELTDSYGYATFIFIAPQVNTPSNVTLIAQASKTGYVDGENQLTIVVNPGILTVEIEADPSTVMSREVAIITVHVKCNVTSVSNALVTISSSHGNFSATNKTTNSKGRCIFIFNAPKTTTQLSVILIANATKNGYISGGNQTTLTITPETITETEGGWPLTTILLIVIPIVVGVIIIVLIKLKIITVSTEEE